MSTRQLRIDFLLFLSKALPRHRSPMRMGRALQRLLGSPWPNWCDPQCPGFFRDGETGRWVRCDDCARTVEQVAPFYDEDVRAFIREIHRVPRWAPALRVFRDRYGWDANPYRHATRCRHATRWRRGGQ